MMARGGSGGAAASSPGGLNLGEMMLVTGTAYSICSVAMLTVTGNS